MSSRPQIHSVPSLPLTESELETVSVPVETQARKPIFAAMTPTTFGTTPYTPLEARQIDEQLAIPLSKRDVKVRPGPGGKRLTYIEGWRAIDIANSIFGFDGWSSQLVSLDVRVCKQTPDKRWHACVMATMRITIRNGAFHEDRGGGHAENKRTEEEAMMAAEKEALTDACKRALKNFGQRLGLSLYSDEHLRTIGSTPSTAPRGLSKTCGHTPEQRANSSVVKQHSRTLPGASGPDTQRVPGQDAYGVRTSREHESRASSVQNQRSISNPPQSTMNQRDQNIQGSTATIARSTSKNFAPSTCPPANPSETNASHLDRANPYQRQNVANYQRLNGKILSHADCDDSVQLEGHDAAKHMVLQANATDRQIMSGQRVTGQQAVGNVQSNLEGLPCQEPSMVYPQRLPRHAQAHLQNATPMDNRPPPGAFQPSKTPENTHAQTRASDDLVPSNGHSHTTTQSGPSRIKPEDSVRDPNGRFVVPERTHSHSLRPSGAVQPAITEGSSANATMIHVIQKSPADCVPSSSMLGTLQAAVSPITPCNTRQQNPPASYRNSHYDSSRSAGSSAQNEHGLELNPAQNYGAFAAGLKRPSPSAHLNIASRNSTNMEFQSGGGENFATSETAQPPVKLARVQHERMDKTQPHHGYNNAQPATAYVADQRQSIPASAHPSYDVRGSAVQTTGDASHVAIISHSGNPTERDRSALADISALRKPNSSNDHSEVEELCAILAADMQ